MPAPQEAAPSPPAASAGAGLTRPAPADGGPASVPPRLPESYPDWSHRLAESYFAGTTALFVLHGNVHDLVPCAGEPGKPTWCGLAEFLATHLFGAWDVVLGYDLGRGLRPLAGSDADRLQSMVRHTAPLGEPARWPREPEAVLHVLDAFLRRTMLADPDRAEADRSRAALSVALVLPYAQYLVPAAGIQALGQNAGSRLVRLLGWAQNPYLKRLNIAICLIADRLSEVNARLIQNPYVATVEIPMPTAGQRAHFIRATAGAAFARDGRTTIEQFAQAANGLTLLNVQLVLAQARTSGGSIDTNVFGSLKKDLIERQCHGLLEFYEPRHGLDMVVGHEAAKQRLRDDAALITHGRLDHAPMGYLICGPVGTGKTFLAECYAGSIGIPCVKLRNFRSKYVGETEGNLEHVLNVLRSLGPVVVIIDEADAALGTREAAGDSGTSARVFSMIASQMGDTDYRGRIVWMLLTSRPDRLPVDLKRQGRAEVHIPLFYPEGADEMRRMFLVMARKNGVTLADGACDHVAPAERRLSGSDIESVVLAANRIALAEGREAVQRAELDRALGDFVPSDEGLAREAQELAAVVACTQLSFLPPHWRERVAAPDGRSAMHERLARIRAVLGS